MIAVSWAWGLLGVIVFLAVGLLAAVALGLVGAPVTFLRRAGQTATAPRIEDGVELPPEVPELTAEEASAEVDEREDG